MYHNKNICLYLVLITAWILSTGNNLCDGGVSFNISVYSLPNFEGRQKNLTVTTCINKLQDNIEYFASIEAYGNCVILYDKDNCNSSNFLKLTPDDYVSRRYVQIVIKLKSLNLAQSIGECHDCVKKSDTENKPSVETRVDFYSFYLRSENSSGSRWLFNSSEMISANKTGFCGIVPENVQNFANLTVFVHGKCVKFYDNSNCITNNATSIQWLNQYGEMTLKRRGFNAIPKSFSHCNRKCSDNLTVVDVEGIVIARDMPAYEKGVRIIYESGNDNDIVANDARFWECYNTGRFDSSGVTRVTVKDMCIVLFKNKHCNTNPIIKHRPVVRDGRSNQIVTWDAKFDESNIRIESILTCGQVLRFESYPAILGNSTNFIIPENDKAEITIFKYKNFQGASTRYEIHKCEPLREPITVDNSILTVHCITFFIDALCTWGGESIFPGSPVLRDFTLLSTHGKFRSVQKCDKSVSAPPSNSSTYTFSMGTKQISSDWTVDMEGGGACWEIPYYYRWGIISSVSLVGGCVQLYAGIVCSPYAQTVRLNSIFFAGNDMTRWGFRAETVIGSFSACNFVASNSSVVKILEDENVDHHPNATVALYKSGQVDGTTSVIPRCSRVSDLWPEHRTEHLQLLSTKNRCIMIFSNENCTMYHNNDILYILNGTSTMAQWNYAEDVFWVNQSLIPRSVIGCEFYESGKSSASHSNLYVYSGIAIGFIICMAAIVILFITNAARKSQLNDAEIETFYNGSDFPCANSDDEIQNKPVNKDYELSQKDFTYVNSNNKSTIVLGSGAFGVVTQGILHCGFCEGTGQPETKNVAIKTPRIGIPVEQIRSILSEIKINIFVGKHKHIVEFIGFCVEEMRYGRISMIFGLCENGSLQSFVSNHSKEFLESFKKSAAEIHEKKFIEANYANAPQFNSTLLVRWCKEISDGMLFLAGIKVLHGDLAARNCLLDGQLSVKITDFGLSRKLYDYGNYVKKDKGLLPWRWLALESLKSFQFSVKSDVWSFGVTMWELFSLAELPYPTLTWNEYFIESLSAGLRLRQPEYCPDRCFEWMERCWLADTEKRIGFNELSTAMATYLYSVEESPYTQI